MKKHNNRKTFSFQVQDFLRETLKSCVCLSSSKCLLTIEKRKLINNVMFCCFFFQGTMAPPATETLLIHRAVAATDDTDYSKKEETFEPIDSKRTVKDNFVITTSDAITPSENIISEIGTDWNFKREIVWFNAIGFLALHLAGLAGLHIMGKRLVDGVGHGCNGYTIAYCKYIFRIQSNGQYITLNRYES